MGYIKAAKSADNASNYATLASQETGDGAQRLLALSVAQLAQAVAELSRSDHRAS